MSRIFNVVTGIIILCGLTVPTATGQDAPGPEIVLTNSASREHLDLTGAWTYSIDPYRDGLKSFHGNGPGLGHRRYETTDVESVTRENPTARYEYDMRREKIVTLPGSWVNHAPELRHYDGLMWYAREFDASPESGQRAFLRFGAANYTAHVYFNGELVGRHDGGFTPFAFEVTDLLQDGENLLVVGVDAQRTDQTVPPPVTDWETYGGLTRPVRLIYTPETFIDEARAWLGKDGSIMAEIALDGPRAGGRDVSVTIDALGLTLDGRTDRNGVWQGSTPAPEDLSLWSPESPALYDVAFTAGNDTLPERIGFRTIEASGTDILLNGEPIYLRGISMHEEELGADPGRIMTEPAIRALLSEIKDGLNGNFVRLAHYPHSELTTRLADEMGLLVWSEIPVYWLIDWDNPDTLAEARTMLAENMTRDMNRASIIIWSVANETPVGDDRNRFLGTLIDDVRTRDDSRLVSAALLTTSETRNGTMRTWIDDPLADNLDILAVNTYNGWYGGPALDGVDDIIWESRHDKPMIFSELGAGALAGFADEEIRRKFSESFQADYYRATLAMSEKIPHLKGMSPWILKDFRSPRRQHPVYQQGWNRKGLISETGQRKQAFYVLSDFYRNMQTATPAGEE
ncbi:beta-glucuronidase [Parvularcula flava]|uniref:Beta-glucuronidase n=1 Tax=Aquisalinus luteolus TaxID=1566827 RepID=A0A8J3EQC5_9PROT|nr:glycoside hydrolase family 2 TIM barrel-domain containing protein [Aquisalinus luteolus]NHK26827.1 beta-glucuronidase [Aquisalinus luteolus]GGH93532.1 beta-glucuronidase [Aquisalinus luteolus]